MESQGEWGQLKFYKVSNLKRKGSGKKMKTSIKESKVFQIALKGGESRNVAWENFDYSMLLSC